MLYYLWAFDNEAASQTHLSILRVEGTKPRHLTTWSMGYPTDCLSTIIFPTEMAIQMAINWSIPHFLNRTKK